MYQSLLFGNAVLLDSEGRFIISKLQRMRENAECRMCVLSAVVIRLWESCIIASEL